MDHSSDSAGGIATHRAVEAAARESRARLLAFVAARAGGDVASAEDALADAFAAALRQWPIEGVPARPEAWLLTAARRRLVDLQRRQATRAATEDALRHALEAAQSAADTAPDFPDERLELLFVCAHPAIGPAARTPLMLQVVLGLDAARIAGAFLASPAAMAQRLVRAKAKIRAAGIRFAPPEREEWPERVGEVLDAIYAAYTCSWDSPATGDAAVNGLAEEAVWLARVAAGLLPGEPEALGLLALVLLSHSRRGARREGGRFVPLDEQDPARWDAAQIAEAEELLARAAHQRAPGRFQLEAAIHRVHAERAKSGRTDWPLIARLYDRLMRHTPALGARIGRAAALRHAVDAAAGLRALEELPAETVRNHQPYWAVRASLLAAAGRSGEARAAYGRAAGLCEDEATRAFLEERRRALPE